MSELQDIIAANKIRDLIYRAISRTCQQVTDGWGILGPSEKERIEGLAETEAEAVELEIGARVQSICDKFIDDFIAGGRPYFSAGEKGIAIKDGAVTLTLTASRDIVPDALYTHRGGFMVIVIPGGATLEALNKQGDLFVQSPAGELAGQLREPEPEPEPTLQQEGGAIFLGDMAVTVEAAMYYRDEFTAALDRLGLDGYDVLQYAPDGPLGELVAEYAAAGWPAVDAARNELADKGRRLIADGPKPEGGKRRAG